MCPFQVLATSKQMLIGMNSGAQSRRSLRLVSSKNDLGEYANENATVSESVLQRFEKIRTCAELEEESSVLQVHTFTTLHTDRRQNFQKVLLLISGRRGATSWPDAQRDIGFLEFHLEVEDDGGSIA